MPARANATRKRQPGRNPHQILAADLIHRIQSGEWKVGEKIPPMDALVHEYPYARMTILKALHDVGRRGYIAPRKGVGTFVLRRNVTGFVGLVFSDDVLRPQETPMPAMLQRRLGVFFERNGYRFQYYIERSSDGEPRFPENLKEDIQAHRIDGIVSVGCNLPLVLRGWPEWSARPLPYVDIGDRKTVAHRVSMDYEGMLDLALKYCRMLRRRRMAIASSIVGDLRQRIEQHGLETRDEWIVPPKEGKATFEQRGFDLMLRLWQATAEKPDALFIEDDIVAKGVTQAILKLGIDVPGQLLVVTHGNRDSGVFYSIPMVRVEFDMEECARLAGELLIEVMGNPGLPPKTVHARSTLHAEDGFAMGTA